MTIYTIGSGKKSAQEFFTLLQQNGVRRVIDIRLNNTSQLAGYTKKMDLEYFLKAIADIDYIHLPEVAPTKQLLDSYKDKKVSWTEYETEYARILEERAPLHRLDKSLFEDACLLCSEPTPKQCHRRLLAEYLEERLNGLRVVHL
ncbi:DUF488 family protein [Sporomusa malonica]|uniref:DUF488 domain-containing protein n=1 Tax=Sporomusa malonica TaxID=112901 RepID=A0A1W2F2V2_9FIRM|nr:DUF488 domain-containing protein [Sporomusa malonica]SMD16132.1 Protein of unknown function, DUF488 [Sporomusa malonica]